ncbi:MAG: hypothetical protein ACPLN0_04150 [Candidatus Hydrothermia bacterium]
MLLVLIFSLFPDSYYRGLPFDALYTASSYCLSSLYVLPNFENPAGFGVLENSGLGVSFTYSPQGVQDILNYGTKVSFKNLSALYLYSQGGGFSYRPVLRKTVNLPDSALDISINEFQLAVSDLLYYKFYGGLNIRYFYVRYAVAGFKNGEPFAEIGSGHGYSLGVGVLFQVPGFSAGFYAQNIFSKVFYKGYSDDILKRYGGVGIQVSPLSRVSFFSDISIYEGEKFSYTFASLIKPLKWLSIVGSYSLPDKNFGAGLGTEYKYGSFGIAYRKKVVSLTLRSYFYE